jgi:hypothetical protein
LKSEPEGCDHADPTIGNAKSKHENRHVRSEQVERNTP